VVLSLHSRYILRHDLYHEADDYFLLSHPSQFTVSNHIYVALGGLVVIVVATGPKVRGFKPGRGDGFLRAIKIRSTPSFGGEVKLETPCRNILRHVKEPLEIQRFF
jgi:hypothetical protein